MSLLWHSTGCIKIWDDIRAFAAVVVSKVLETWEQSQTVGVCNALEMSDGEHEDLNHHVRLRKLRSLHRLV